MSNVIDHTSGYRERERALCLCVCVCVFIHLKSPSLIYPRWKQLIMVTMFYFIFVCLFAIMGVHFIGGLEQVCMYKNTYLDETGDIV